MPRRGSAASLAGMSRKASMASIQEVEGEAAEGEPAAAREPAGGEEGGATAQQRRRPEGLRTFVKRMQDEHGLE